MTGKNLLALVLIWFFTLAQPSWAQKSQYSIISIDSTISLTSSLLNSRLTLQAKPKIDSLLDYVSAVKSNKNLLLQLKVKSLQAKYLLLTQGETEFSELYEWWVFQEPFCKTEEEMDLFVRFYSNAGVAFKRLGQLTRSEEAFLKSAEFLKKMKSPDLILLGSVFVNTGNALKQIGEFDRSIEYFEQSIRYFDEYVKKSEVSNAITRIADLKSKAMDNLGLVYQSLNDHRKAIDIFHQCISFKLQYYPKNINEFYTNLVISLIEIGSFSEAKTTIELILGEYKSGLPKDQAWALAKLNLADINFRQSGDTAMIFRELESLNKTIQIEIPGAIDISIVSNQFLASLLKDQGKHEQALAKWSVVMGQISQQGQSFGADQVPYDIITLKFNKLIELMNLNSRIYFDWGMEQNDPKKLKMAEERYSYTLNLIDSLRNSLELQSSKLQVGKMQRTTYDQLIYLEYTLFQTTGDSAYISKIFNTMEQSKSAGLWSLVKDIEFKNSLIPPEDLEKENAIRKNITDLQGKIIEAGTDPDSDPDLIGRLQQANLFLNQQIDSIKNTYQQKYPDYYQAKFDRTTISLEDVCLKLTGNQVLIEYAVAYDYLYIICATNSKTNLYRISRSQQSDEDLSYLLNFMKGHVESLTAQARTRYCEAAFRLYEFLLSPLASQISSRELVIIPDGLLSYLPFETLLEGKPNGNRGDYRKLPYLIRNHSISYGLTATVFFYKSQRISKPTRGLLAIAPTYNFSSESISDYLRMVESGLPELKGTYQESRAIKRMFGGRLIAGSKATEAEFKKIGPKYGILHLAMHTLPDRNNSLNSGLVFTPGVDRKEDGILFGHEVYNLSLNARLTVLSACETGSGQIAAGEGILSFGRAFIVAGCPNLIMTLWTVDDLSSQKVMVSFYQALRSGEGIADALKTSKLTYLKTADQLHAHPHYWAGFIELGQNQNIGIAHRKSAVLLLVLFFAFSVLFIVYIHPKKNPRRSRDIMKRNSRKL